MSTFIADQIRSQLFFIRVSRIWMRVWLTLIGCPLKISGQNNFKQGKNYVVVFNHNALLDVPLSAPFVPGANKTIAKDSFARIPLFGWFYSKGSVLVNRKNDKSRVESFEKMKYVIHQGMHMCIYPEGTRNRTHLPLKSFYDGAFKLSVETDKEILPCVLTGTSKAMPINKIFYLMPTRLYMEFLNPIAPKGKNVNELKEITHFIMKVKITSQKS
jgi:1-acyl-sn-glycerol-3-phosphate acyltransferase